MGVAADHGGELSQTCQNPRVIVVGPMLGNQPGHVPFVGEALGSHLAGRGYPVLLTSERRRRLSRFADITSTLIRHSRKVDVQILQVYGGLSFVVEDAASSLGALFGQGIIMHLHGGAMPEFVSRHPVWTQRVLRRAAAIVAPSTFLRKALAPLGFDVRVIPNAVDISRYQYRQRSAVQPRLFWMRTFHDVYNPEMAVRVFSRVRRVYPHATLVMAGQDKGIQASVQRFAESLKVADGIRFPGYLDAQAKLREAAEADIFLNTNRVDNTPVSVIEACAMGLPVVATDVGGIADLLTHAETGLLVPDDDDESMAEAVLKLLREPELSRQLSRLGRAMAEEFSWERTTPQWESLLSEVLTRRASAGMAR